MRGSNNATWISFAKRSILSFTTAFALIASSSSVQAQWSLLDDFENLTAGDFVEGTSGPGALWTGDGSSINTAQLDPSDSSNLAMRVSGTPGNGVLRAQFSNAGDQISSGSIGTLYYRFRTPVGANGTSDHVVGLTDNNAITNFNFKSGLRNTVPALVNNLDARNGGGYQSVASLADETWYSLWMVSSNDAVAGTFDLYLQSNTDANFTTQTAVITGAAYRVNGATDIVNAYFRNANNTGGVAGNDLYFDDIWVDSTASNLTVPVAIPEPSSAALLLSGMGMFFARRRRR